MTSDKLVERVQHLEGTQPRKVDFAERHLLEHPQSVRLGSRIEQSSR